MRNRETQEAKPARSETVAPAAADQGRSKSPLAVATEAPACAGAARHDRSRLQPARAPTVVAITVVVIFMPIGLIFWQSLLNAPFFNPAHRYGLDAVRVHFRGLRLLDLVRQLDR